jgi:16S rRNA (guanine966-N2)-methyltransferase
LRIIGGAHRGRKLPIPNLEGLRPTSDRIRETVFNWLQVELPGMNVLDLFAGTGALGLEALSREAKYAAFVEPQSMAASFISQSIATLKQENARVYTQSAEHFLNTPGETFDLVFVDPPFTLDLWERSLELLIEQHRLSEGAFVYLECPKHQAVNIPDSFETVKDKTGGKVRFRLLRMA